MIDSSTALAGLASDRLRIGKGNESEMVEAEANVLTYRDLALQADLDIIQGPFDFNGRSQAADTEIMNMRFQGHIHLVSDQVHVTFADDAGVLQRAERGQRAEQVFAVGQQLVGTGGDGVGRALCETDSETC